jgi:hypothetical protein
MCNLQGQNVGAFAGGVCGNKSSPTRIGAGPCIACHVQCDETTDTSCRGLLCTGCRQKYPYLICEGVATPSDSPACCALPRFPAFINKLLLSVLP